MHMKKSWVLLVVLFCVSGEAVVVQSKKPSSQPSGSFLSSVDDALFQARLAFSQVPELNKVYSTMKYILSISTDPRKAEGFFGRSSLLAYSGMLGKDTVESLIKDIAPASSSLNRTSIRLSALGGAALMASQFSPYGADLFYLTRTYGLARGIDFFQTYKSDGVIKRMAKLGGKLGVTALGYGMLGTSPILDVSSTLSMTDAIWSKVFSPSRRHKKTWKDTAIEWGKSLAKIGGVAGLYYGYKSGLAEGKISNAYTAYIHSDMFIPGGTQKGASWKNILREAGKMIFACGSMLYLSGDAAVTMLPLVSTLYHAYDAMSADDSLWTKTKNLFFSVLPGVVVETAGTALGFAFPGKMFLSSIAQMILNTSISPEMVAIKTAMPTLSEEDKKNYILLRDKINNGQKLSPQEKENFQTIDRKLQENLNFLQVARHVANFTAYEDGEARTRQAVLPEDLPKILAFQNKDTHSQAEELEIGKLFQNSVKRKNGLIIMNALRDKTSPMEEEVLDFLSPEKKEKFLDVLSKPSPSSQELIEAGLLYQEASVPYAQKVQEEMYALMTPQERKQYENWTRNPSISGEERQKFMIFMQGLQQRYKAKKSSPFSEEAMERVRAKKAPTQAEWVDALSSEKKQELLAILHKPSASTFELQKAGKLYEEGMMEYARKREESFCSVMTPEEKEYYMQKKKNPPRTFEEQQEFEKFVHAIQERELKKTLAQASPQQKEDHVQKHLSKVIMDLTGIVQYYAMMKEGLEKNNTKNKQGKDESMVMKQVMGHLEETMKKSMAELRAFTQDPLVALRGDREQREAGRNVGHAIMLSVPEAERGEIRKKMRGQYEALSKTQKNILEKLSSSDADFASSMKVYDNIFQGVMEGTSEEEEKRRAALPPSSLASSPENILTPPTGPLDKKSKKMQQEKKKVSRFGATAREMREFRGKKSKSRFIPKAF